MVLIFSFYALQDNTGELENHVFDKSDSPETNIDSSYDIMLQKYNENVKLTEELLRRIVVLEEKSERCITCRIITKV